MNCTELFNQAREHHRAGRVHRAESDYRQVLRQDPTHDRSHYLLGLIALDSRQLHEALELFKKAIDIAPNMPAYHVNFDSPT
jgi:tetratricopeptide (TPR) repeat protein